MSGLPHLVPKCVPQKLLVLRILTFKFRSVATPDQKMSRRNTIVPSLSSRPEAGRHGGSHLASKIAAFFSADSSVAFKIPFTLACVAQASIAVSHVYLRYHLGLQPVQLSFSPAVNGELDANGMCRPGADSSPLSLELFSVFGTTVHAAPAVHLEYANTVRLVVASMSAMGVIAALALRLLSGHDTFRSDLCTYGTLCFTWLVVNNGMGALGIDVDVWAQRRPYVRMQATTWLRWASILGFLDPFLPSFGNAGLVEMSRVHAMVTPQPETADSATTGHAEAPTRVDAVPLVPVRPWLLITLVHMPCVCLTYFMPPLYGFLCTVGLVVYAGAVVIPARESYFRAKKSQLAASIAGSKEDERLEAAAMASMDAVMRHFRWLTVASTLACFTMGLCLAGIPSWVAEHYVSASLLQAIHYTAELTDGGV